MKKPESKKPAWSRLNRLVDRLRYRKTQAGKPDARELRGHEHPKEPERNKK